MLYLTYSRCVCDFEFKIFWGGEGLADSALKE